jgi:hypothetical protein
MGVRQEDRGRDQEQQEQQEGLGAVEAMVAMLAGVGEGEALVVGSGKAGSTGGAGHTGTKEAGTGGDLIGRKRILSKKYRCAK